MMSSSSESHAVSTMSGPFTMSTIPSSSLSYDPLVTKADAGRRMSLSGLSNFACLPLYRVFGFSRPPR